MEIPRIVDRIFASLPEGNGWFAAANQMNPLDDLLFSETGRESAVALAMFASGAVLTRTVDRLRRSP